MVGRSSPAPRMPLTGRGLREGDSGSRVATLQRCLAEAGTDPGEVDGLFGFRTRRALERLQRLYALDDDGIAGRLTLAALRARALAITGFTPEPGGNVIDAAEHMRCSPEAVERANRRALGRALAPDADLGGVTLVAARRRFARIPFGYLDCTAEVVARPDGTVNAPQADPDATSARKRLVLRIETEADVPRREALAKLARQIRAAMAEFDCPELLVALPETRVVKVSRVVALLRTLRNDIPSKRRVTVCVPVVGAASRPGQPVIPLATLPQTVGLVLMAWRLPQGTGQGAGSTGSAGLIAPIPWVAQTVRLALCGVRPWRVLLGTCGCAFDTVMGAESAASEGPEAVTVPVPYARVARALAAYCAEPRHLSQEGQALYEYTRRGQAHRIAFEDSTTIGFKANLVRRMNLGGLAVFDSDWADPGCESAVASAFPIAPEGDVVPMPGI